MPHKNRWRDNPPREKDLRISTCNSIAPCEILLPGTTKLSCLQAMKPCACRRSAMIRPIVHTTSGAFRSIGAHPIVYPVPIASPNFPFWPLGDHHSFPPQWSSITFFLIRPHFSSPIFATVGAEIPLRSGDKIRSGGSAPGWKRDAEPEPSLCAPWGPSRLCAISVLKTLSVWPKSSFGYA